MNNARNGFVSNGENSGVLSASVGLRHEAQHGILDKLGFISLNPTDVNSPSYRKKCNGVRNIYLADKLFSS